MWYQVELPSAMSVAELQIDSQAPFGGGGRGGGRGGAPAAPGAGRGRGPQIPASGPVAYSVQLSADGTTWSAPVAQGPGRTPTTIIWFAPARARFIRITQTGAALGNEAWAIQQIRIFALPEKS
jgi:hypothetical protein